MTGREDGRGPDVGSLAEEAAKLFGALDDWAREQGGGLGESVSGASEHVRAAAHEVNTHVATGAAECSMCPICRTVHAARHLSPEVKSHLASAAASLMHAAAGVMETVVPNDHPGRRSSTSGVEHIDLDDDDEGDGVWPDPDRT